MQTGTRRRGRFEDREAQKSTTDDSVKVYFADIKKFPLLTAKEEKVLSRKVAKKDENARKLMIVSNLRLVVKIAKKYLNKGLHLQDLISEGNIGLIKSVERFKATKGFRFSTYATYWIRQTIERAIANQGSTVRLPIHIVADLGKIYTRTKRFQRQGIEPSIEELAGATGLSARYLKRLKYLQQGRNPMSLENQNPDFEGMTFLERKADEKAPCSMSLTLEQRRKEFLEGLLGRLEDKEKYIIFKRFKEGIPLETIGKELGVTRERVRQVEAKALNKLREIVKKENYVFDDLVA